MNVHFYFFMFLSLILSSLLCFWRSIINIIQMDNEVGLNIEDRYFFGWDTLNTCFSPINYECILHIICIHKPELFSGNIFLNFDHLSMNYFNGWDSFFSNIKKIFLTQFQIWLVIAIRKLMHRFINSVLKQASTCAACDFLFMAVILIWIAIARVSFYLYKH